MGQGAGLSGADSDPPSYNVNTSDYQISAGRGLRDVLDTAAQPASVTAQRARGEMLANPPDYMKPDNGPGMSGYDPRAQERMGLAKQLPGIQLGSPFGALLSTGAKLVGDDDAQAAQWGLLGAGLESGAWPLGAERMGMAPGGTRSAATGELSSAYPTTYGEPPTWMAGSSRGLAVPSEPAAAGLVDALPEGFGMVTKPQGTPPEDPPLTKADFPEVGRQISQKQNRHITDHPEWIGKKGGHLPDVETAQDVLDAYHSGEADIILKSAQGSPIVKLGRVTGFHNSPKNGFINQPTNLFMIKGTRRPSVVPVSPNKENNP